MYFKIFMESSDTAVLVLVAYNEPTAINNAKNTISLEGSSV